MYGFSAVYCFFCYILSSELVRSCGQINYNPKYITRSNLQALRSLGIDVRRS